MGFIRWSTFYELDQNIETTQPTSKKRVAEIAELYDLHQLDYVTD